MKARILFCLALLFALFTGGSLIALFAFDRTTELYAHIAKLHSVEGHRREMLTRIFRLQGDLFTSGAYDKWDTARELKKATELEALAERCGGCHHVAAVAARITGLQRDIHGYVDRLGRIQNVPAGSAAAQSLKYAVAVKGEAVLAKLQSMSTEATTHLSDVSTSTETGARRGKYLLAATFLLTCLVGALVALHLTRSITRPVGDMVAATRAVAGGELGHTLSGTYAAEFGELARAFNSMSLSLKADQEALVQEVHERRRIEGALRKSEERYALAERGANDGLWDWDLATDRIYFSPRWKAMIGYGEDDIGAKPDEWFELVHAEDRPKLRGRLTAHFSGEAKQFSVEHRIRHRDGAYRWVLTRGIAVRDENGVAVRIAGSQTDVTERKQAEQQLFHDAFHDTLTGLPNRALFVNRLAHAFGAAARQKTDTFALLFLDLDRFKFVNDNFGHAAGDRLLRDFAARLADSLRPGDTVARFGGDEFAILLGQVNGPGDAAQVAERILETMRQPFRIEDKPLFTSTSIGIAIASAQHAGPDQLLRDADLALYQAKANGKARYELFDALMRTRTLAQMQLEASLRGALDRGELRVYYQPIFDLQRSSISGFEALLRWQHPERGLVLPQEFIPIAEECGLIGRIGEWVLREACAKLRHYAASNGAGPALTMNVNISTRQLTPLLIEQVKKTLRETGVAPECLGLEITESVVLEEAEATDRLLRELRDLGVGIHIDDFGTGYSSLSYLHRFPVDVLKIDKSFVGAARESRENLEIVRTIVDLAKILDMEVIAEGIESQEQMALLEELGCRYIQGYFVSKPAEMAEILDTHCALALVARPRAANGDIIEAAA